MATEKAEAPEGFTTVEQPGNDSDDFDTEWLDRPALGDSVQGTLLSINYERGEYDSEVLEIRLTEPAQDFEDGDLVAMWSTNGITAALEEADARGQEIAIICSDTFDTEDGERRRYNVAVRDD